MKNALILFAASIEMVLPSCQKIGAGFSPKAKPVLDILQENILPIGEIKVVNRSSYSLEIQLDGSGGLLPAGGSKSYSSLKSEVDIHLWMRESNSDSRIKVAWCNSHPNVVGTQITIHDLSP